MDVDQLVISARPRAGWSAIDLGFLLAREWWWPLFLSWLIPAAAVFGVASLVFYSYPTVSLFLVWWLKPLFDRIPLYIQSKRLFGEPLSLKQALGEIRRIYPIDLLPWLFIRRLNPMRSFVMPVTVLEGLKGEARERRLMTLQRDTGGVATWLFVICVHIEVLLPLTGIALIAWLIPEQVGFSMWNAVLEREGEALYLFNILSFLAMALVAPFYVSAGFMLYINRRIELEGWDIEVTFRNLVSRVVNKVTGPAVSAVLALVCLGCVVNPLTVLAEESAKLPVETLSDAEYAKAQIDTVLAGESFHRMETVTSWHWKYFPDEAEEQEIPEWIIGLVESLEQLWPSWFAGMETDLTLLLALLLCATVIFLLLCILVYVLMRYRPTLRRWMGVGQGVQASPVEPPARLFGLELAPESLPADVAQTVAALCRAGDRRAGVALLYRATLSTLIDRFEFNFPSSFTEAECAALVEARQQEKLSCYFRQLTEGWRNLAYGHIEPDTLWIIDLCQQWSEVFPDE